MAFLLVLLTMIPTWTGRVLHPSGTPVAGVFVTAHADGVRTSARTDNDGTFSIQAQADSLVVHGRGWQRVSVAAPDPDARLELTVQPAPHDPAQFPASVFLNLLPEGEEKRRFILDCTGCHGLDWPVVSSGDRMKTANEWQARVDQMLGFAGSRAGFPIMSPYRYEAPTVDFMTTHLRLDALDLGAAARRLEAPPSAEVITEFPVPVAGDLPHDLIVGTDGRVVITGMLTRQMYVLNPDTGAMESEPVQAPGANPRALVVDPDGTWWVLNGAGMGIARRDATGVWDHWSVGMYGHSLAIAPDGRVWTNGHFTARPEEISVLDPETGSVDRIALPVPDSEDGGSTIPYGLRIDVDGRLWMTQLAGNGLIRYDPADGSTRYWSLPVTHSGPRRPDIGPDGRIWIPEYANGRVTVFNPADESFRSWDLPIRDSLPYIVRVHPRTGHVWVATGAAGAVFVLDPAKDAIRTIPLPTHDALVRHMDIDARTGDVWLAYGNSPARFAAVARIRTP